MPELTKSLEGGRRRDGSTRMVIPPSGRIQWLANDTSKKGTEDKYEGRWVPSQFVLRYSVVRSAMEGRVGPPFVHCGGVGVWGVLYCTSSILVVRPGLDSGVSSSD